MSASCRDEVKCILAESISHGRCGLFSGECHRHTSDTAATGIYDLASDADRVARFVIVKDAVAVAVKREQRTLARRNSHKGQLRASRSGVQ